MESPDYVIRTMTLKEVALAVEWAANEGWNPGLRDAEAFYATDPEGFLVEEIGGELVACISAVKYGRSFGFIGFYIVRPDRRGQGLGLRIWNASLERLAGRNVGLDGVLAQQGNYRKSGFKLAYRNIRFEGIASAASAKAEIVDLAHLPLATVATYDQPFFPDERGAFLKSWLAQPGSIAQGFMDGGRLGGYGVIRPCRVGYKIGPLFADGPNQAEALFSSLVASVSPGTPLFLDVPETNPDAVELAQRHRMQRVFETARMYTGDAPDLPLRRLFGVTSFELG